MQFKFPAILMFAIFQQNAQTKLGVREKFIGMEKLYSALPVLFIMQG